jgi:uncharacterized iron-regulated membrane protein
VTTASRVRFWFLVHKWTSLASTIFLLILCLTGLPLIFSEEIGRALDDDPPYVELPQDAPRANLDDLVAASRARFPDDVVTSVFVDDDEPQVVVSMGSSWQAVDDDPRSGHWLKYDARTGELLKQARFGASTGQALTDFLLELHRDLFLGFPGEMFLALMALIVVMAIVSGLVLYGRYMRHLAFGTLRRDRSRRLLWFDLHDLVGVATVAWLAVVGLTGVLNELSTPLFTLFQQTDVRAMLEPWRGKEPPPPNELGSAQAAFVTAQHAVPGMKVVSVVFPGGQFGSPHHYLLWAKGATPLTARLFDPILVDARSGALTSVVQMPWYLRALELSRPLHFGDYGGLPLKIIWALLDIATMGVLVTGLYLWLSRRRSSIEAVVEEIERGGHVESQTSAHMKAG